ncbi:hypothetical protein D8S78_19885 [Natrialba swarupiae]|nr:hypothetical protein [Natrialba swarupiae]
MHGIVHKTLKEYVVERTDEASWNAIVERAGLEPSLYLPVSHYDDAEFEAILETLSAVAVQERAQIERSFGRMLAPPSCRRSTPTYALTGALRTARAPRVDHERGRRRRRGDVGSGTHLSARRRRSSSPTAPALVSRRRLRRSGGRRRRVRRRCNGRTRGPGRRGGRLYVPGSTRVTDLVPNRC